MRAAFPLTTPILAGFVFLGITCGIYAGSLGLPWWVPVLMSIVIFAGSAEFVVASQLAGAFDPLTTLADVLIINARHLFYGLSMLERFRGLGRKRPYLIFARRRRGARTLRGRLRGDRARFDHRGLRARLRRRLP